MKKNRFKVVVMWYSHGKSKEVNVKSFILMQTVLRQIEPELLESCLVMAARNIEKTVAEFYAYIGRVQLIRSIFPEP